MPATKGGANGRPDARARPTVKVPEPRALERLARERFGVERFRLGQRAAIEAVLGGDDVLVVMPTGAGKTLCYQIPALLLPGPTVVVSPLLSLMKDQRDRMEADDIPATKLDSTLTAAETREAVDQIRSGEPELIYLTPERLENREYLALLARAGVSLFVVDEAHCVSQWGHDFRPAYLSVRDAIHELGHPRVLALTATATPAVTADIVKQLDLHDVQLVNTGIERPNLLFEVYRTVNEEAKLARLLALLDESGGSAIVYTATVRAAEEVTRRLRAARGDGAAATIDRYHGKMRAAERHSVQERFMADELRVIVATKAFGLGIDKPNIRAVVHHQLPDSLESYYQEAGRAGRDGEPARAALLYRVEDRRIQTYFLGGKYPRREETLRVYGALLRLAGEGDAAHRGVTFSELAAAAELPPRKTKVLVALLEGAGIVERRRRLHPARRITDPVELEALLGAYEERHSDDRARLEAMEEYAQTGRCRVAMLRAYFGEPEPPEHCGHCDNCRQPLAQRLAAETPA